MKRPSFQFYPDRWRNNAKLRRCSWAARGAWSDVLCILHESEDEYGVLRWPLVEISNAIGAPLKLLRELVDKGVMKGGDRDVAAYVYTPRHGGKVGTPATLLSANPGPCWYSSRMVRDEYLRGHRGASTRFGGSGNGGAEPTQPSPSQRQGCEPNQRQGAPPTQRQGDGALSLTLEVQEPSVGENLGNSTAVDNSPKDPVRADKSAKINGYKHIPPWHKDPAEVAIEAQRRGIERRPNESQGDFTDRVKHAVQHPSAH